jgi:hypothetical protein
VVLSRVVMSHTNCFCFSTKAHLKLVLLLELVTFVKNVAADIVLLLALIPEYNNQEHDKQKIQGVAKLVATTK